MHSKTIEQLAVMFALGATAFVLWRAWRDSKTLGTLGATAQTVPNTTPTMAQPTYTPTAGALFANSIPTLADNPDAGAGLRAIYLH